MCTPLASVQNQSDVWTNLAVLLVGTMAFVAAVLLVGPFGDFPLNDDWAFAQTTARLVTEGDFRPTEWSSMTLFSNVLWGSVFCRFDDCSFDVLRLSTLVLGWLGGVGVWFTLRELHVSPWASLVAVFTLLFNPLYFALAHTYMTDVPFTAFIIWAAYFLLRYLRTDAERDLVFGAVLCAVAILSRQIGLVVPLAFLPTLLWVRGFSRRGLRDAIAPLVVALGTLLVFQAWLDVTGRTPALYGAQIAGVAEGLADLKTIRNQAEVLQQAYFVLCYLGLMLLPVTLLTAWPNPATRRLQHWITLGALGLFALVTARLYLYAGQMPLMPMLENMIEPTGIGPLTLRGAVILGHPSVQPLGTWFWFGVTLLSLLGAALLVGAVSAQMASLVSRPRVVRISPATAAAVFYLLAAAISLSPLLLIHLFDRYLIPVLALLIPGLFALRRAAVGDCPARRSWWLAALLLICASASFSIAGTHDWLAWNRVRWEALADLERQGVSAKDIDGGFEFNGLRLYNDLPARERAKTWWWLRDGEYKIAFGRIPGYREVAVHEYDRWLTGGSGQVVVLQRE